MANGGQIDIKVNFIGLDNLDSIMGEVGKGAAKVGQQVGQVTKTFDNLIDEGVDGLEDLKEGLGGLGEGLGDLNEEYEKNNKRQKENNKENKKAGKLFDVLSGSIGSTGQAFNTLGGEANQALGGLTSSAGGLVEGLVNIGKTATTAGLSFTALAGPIGLAVMAVFELVQAMREYDDLQSGVTAKVEAYKASLSEMTAVVETLAAKQVALNKDQLRQLKELNNEGKIRIEQAQVLEEQQADNFAIVEREKVNQKRLREEIQKTNKQAARYPQLLQLVSKLQSDLARSQNTQAKAQEKINNAELKAQELRLEGLKFRTKFEQTVKALEETAPDEVKKRANVELSFMQNLEALKTKALGDGVESRRKLAQLELTQRLTQIAALESLTEEGRDRAADLAQEIYTAQLKTIEKNEKTLARARYKARAKARKAEQARELADQRRREEEEDRLLYQVSINRLKLTLDGFEQERAIIETQYDEQLRLAGENYEKQIIAKQNYILASKALDKKEEEDELAAFIRRRDAIVAANQEEIRLAIEKNKRINAAQNEVIQGAKDTAKAMALSSVASIASSVAAGDSFNKILSDQLDAIKREAAVQAALNAAYGLAAAAMGNFKTAGDRLQAALAFGGVSALAGTLGGGGGGGSSSGGGASPTGAPLVSTPDREPVNDNNQPLVFNISMGTVYSTEETALTALTSAITREQNRHRRGAPRNA